MLTVGTPRVTAQSTFQDWVREGKKGHPALEAIDRDYEAGRLSRREAVEQKLRVITAPETASPAYAALELGDPVKCLTPLLLEASVLGIHVQPFVDPKTTLIEVNNDPQSLISPMGLFRVVYYTSGTHAISLEDTDQNGVPDYAELAAAFADSSYRHQINTLGFADIFPTKSLPLAINIRALASGTYGYVSPFAGAGSAIFVQNDYNKPQFNKNDDDDKPLGALKVTIAHELKHAIQSIYISPHNCNPQLPPSQYRECVARHTYSWIEMDATLMEEVVFDNVNDYYNYLNSSQSVFKAPQNTVMPGNYYHSSWALYFAERFGIEFWKETWDEFLIQNPNPDQIAAMSQVLSRHDAMLSTELTRSYLWHLASGSNAAEGYGFSEAAHYPDIKLEATYASPSEEIEFAVASVPSFAARLYMLDFSAQAPFMENEELDIYFSNQVANQDLSMGLLAFYNDGSVEEYIPVRTSQTEMRVTPSFDYPRLRRLGVAFVNAGGPASAGSVSLKKQIDVSIDDPVAHLPDQIELHPAYPNPFNPTTNIPFSLRQSAHVELAVFDITGRRVATLVDGFLQAGGHTASFDGRNLGSGMYVARLTAGEFVGTAKLLLVK